MNKKIIERRARTPTWIRNAAEAKLVRQIHDQWCTDNGYRITEHVPRGKRGYHAANVVYLQMCPK